MPSTRHGPYTAFFTLTTDGPDEFIEILLVVIYRHLLPLTYRSDRVDKNTAIAYFGLGVGFARMIDVPCRVGARRPVNGPFRVQFEQVSRLQGVCEHGRDLLARIFQNERSFLDILVREKPAPENIKKGAFILEYTGKKIPT